MLQQCEKYQAFLVGIFFMSNILVGPTFQVLLITQSNLRVELDMQSHMKLTKAHLAQAYQNVWFV